jgi:choline kinase
MKVILLAAGRGTRISRSIDGSPKCCLKINDTVLINHSIDVLRKNGFKEIAVVTGYKSDFIRNIVDDPLIKYYFNPFYSVTNSIASLWFAKEFIGKEDVYIMNADLFFESSILDKLKESTYPITLVSDSTRIEGADYKFNWENDKLIKFGKDLSLDETTGEYVGIGKIKLEFIDLFLKKLDEMIVRGDYGSWWEDVLYDFVRNNEQEINIIDVQGNDFWAEIDYVEDYNRILSYLKK